MEPESEVAALRAEVAKLRRQASASRREVAVWRELALREKCCLTALPEELLQHIVNFIPLAFQIARKAQTCKAISVAVYNALKARPFSSEVVTLDEHTDAVEGVAAAPDGRVVTGSEDKTVKVWRDGACVRTIKAHDDWVRSVAVLPGASRFVSASDDGTAKLWTLDVALERGAWVGTYDIFGCVNCVAALPDGVHFVIGLSQNSRVALREDASQMARPDEHEAVVEYLREEAKPLTELPPAERAIRKVRAAKLAERQQQEALQRMPNLL